MESWVLANAEDLQFALFFVVLAVFGGVEALAPRRRGPMMRKTRWVTNFILTVLNIVVMGLLPVVDRRRSTVGRSRRRAR